MKMGWIKPKVQKTKEEEEQERFYMLWSADDQVYPTVHCFFNDLCSAVTKITRRSYMVQMGKALSFNTNDL